MYFTIYYFSSSWKGHRHAWRRLSCNLCNVRAPSARAPRLFLTTRPGCADIPARRCVPHERDHQVPKTHATGQWATRARRDRSASVRCYGLSIDRGKAAILSSKRRVSDFLGPWAAWGGRRSALSKWLQAAVEQWTDFSSCLCRAEVIRKPHHFDTGAWPLGSHRPRPLCQNAFYG